MESTVFLSPVTFHFAISLQRPYEAILQNCGSM